MTLLLVGDNPDGSKLYSFQCPACGNHHGFTVGPKPEGSQQPRWTFDGNMAKPTFSPSLRCLKPEGEKLVTTCHLNITAGQIVFHGDCPHAFAGKTVPMIDLDAVETIATETKDAAPDVQPEPCPACHGTKTVTTQTQFTTTTTACPKCCPATAAAK